MVLPGKKRTCFVIGPIGAPGSEERYRSDQMLTHIIGPAAKNCGYKILRADKISQPGIITSQIVECLLDSPMVVADLTGKNPNVFYELAVRHAVRKPVVQVIEAAERIPFDVASIRTIRVDHRDLDSAARCKEEIISQMKSVEKNPEQVDTPISTAIDLKVLRESGKPLERGTADVLLKLQELRSMTAELAAGMRRPDMDVRALERADRIVAMYEYLVQVTEVKDGRSLPPDHVRDLHMVVGEIGRTLAGFLADVRAPSAVVERIEFALRRRGLANVRQRKSNPGHRRQSESETNK